MAAGRLASMACALPKKYSTRSIVRTSSREHGAAAFLSTGCSAAALSEEDLMIVDEIRHIAVVGAGLMGHGIAQEFALAGYEVHLHSRREESRQTALKNIQ